MNIFVTTPRGRKLHGVIKDNEFVRYVDFEKDRMRMFDAWSIHPDAIPQLAKLGVSGLRYIDQKNEVTYTLSLGELQDMISGALKDSQGRQQAWQQSFTGGDTVYIKRSAFRQTEKPFTPSKEFCCIDKKNFGQCWKDHTAKKGDNEIF